MHIYSYVIRYDTGFAPNPYGGFLTLATCKPKIRKFARAGDYIAGTGSASTVGNGQLVYAAEIGAVVPLQDYGRLREYRIKRPTSRGPDWRRFGDNIYFVKNGEWYQRRNDFHQLLHLEDDVAGANVLVCHRFWYFGRNAIRIPAAHQSIAKKGCGHKKITDQTITTRFIAWLESLPSGNHSERQEQMTSSTVGCRDSNQRH